MGVCSRTVIFTIYNISCDYCNRSARIDTSYLSRVFNKRDAVRSMGWQMQRGDKVKCNFCICHK